MSRVPGHCTGRLEHSGRFRGRPCFVLANFGSADAVGGGDGLLLMLTTMRCLPLMIELLFPFVQSLLGDESLLPGSRRDEETHMHSFMWAAI